MANTVYTADGDWLSGPRPVVNSAGQKFSSITKAAAAMGTLTAINISTALLGTEHGLYRTAGGLQWAYLNDEPVIWPVTLRRGRRPLKSKLPVTPLTEIEVPEKALFSTGQIGKLIGCTSVPVKTAILEGRLQGTLTPGGHGRVSRDALIAWLPTLGLCSKEDRYVPNWVI